MSVHVCVILYLHKTDCVVADLYVKPPTSWSKWCSRDKPSGSADYELHRKAMKKCPDICRKPMDVECRVIGTEMPWNQTGDVLNMPCTLKGLNCKNKEQDDKKCEDYEVRYKCPPDRDECLDGTAQCDKNAKCINTHGAFKCQCETGFIGTGEHCYEGAKCTAWGDPHYITFDEKKYNFQGLCKYRLAEPCKDFGGVPDFNVISKNKPFKKKEGIAITKFVEVTVYGFFIRMEESKVLINDQEVTLPQLYDPASKEWEGSFLEIKAASRGTTIVTDFGFVVDYDGKSRVEIHVPKVLKTHMCGLCGSYSGDGQYRLPNGNLVTDEKQMADAWSITDDDPLCQPMSAEEERCSQEAMDKARVRCQLIEDNNGPFGECLTKLFGESSKYTESCIFDICVVPENDEFFCPAIEAFAVQCEDAQFTVEWRTPDRCPPDCAINMHYDTEASSCPASCSDFNAPLTCDKTDIAACVCDDGYVMSGTKCVLEGECGCTIHNKYYKVGEKWFEDKCTALCECFEPGETECDNTVQCHGDGECYVVDDGSNSCRCKKGFKGTGTECYDEDECSSDSHKCDNNARCVNGQGGYDCICKAGFTGDGFACEDVDECKDETDQCSPFAQCHNDVGQYTCLCNEGFDGDGRTCIEEKPEEPEEPVECSVFQKDLCVECADCVLLPDGSSGCVCPEGAMGDGKKGDDHTGCRVPSCPMGMIKHEDGCFSFKDSPKTFTDARKDCQAEGGDLATILDDSTAEFVKEQMTDLGLSGQFWIGYTDEKMDEIFAWVDDSASDFENWAEGEPKEEGKALKDCAAVGDTSEFKFTTHQCDLKAGFVCRKPLQLTPCPNGWEMFEGECYHGSKRKQTYIEAYLRCVVHGANLVSILTVEEEEFIKEEIVAGDEQISWWSGLTQGLTGVETQFVWADGEELAYQNWAEGEPDQPTKERCMSLNSKLEWNAMNCETKMGLICKRNENVKEKCPNGAIRVGKVCVKVTPDPTPQPEAEEDCRKMGGGLVSVHSQFEQDVISRYLGSQNQDLSPWIGLVERGALGPGEFIWSDRTPLDYENWGPKQPNDDTDRNNCVIMVQDDKYAWNDINCNQELPYLCQYRNTPCRDDEVCHENAQCSFGQCRCKKGFMGDGKDVCDDIKECDEGNPCPVGATCVNTEGGYNCDCESGFIKSGDQCISLTKCETDADCNTLGECKDENCRCQSGYKGDGKQKCEDGNECEDGTYECNPNADCQDKEGGYDCVCKDGFIGDGVGCQEMPRNCEEVRLQNPESKSGSYKVDPDGPGGLPSFTVMCVIRPEIGITVIPSDSQKPRPVKSTDPTPEAEKKPVKYTKSEEQIKAIIDVSEFCYQNILYKCTNGAKLQGAASWENTEGLKTPFDQCYCGMLGTCATPGSQCNCDGTPMGDQQDETKVIDKTQLPVKSFNVAGVEKGQKATTSVGPLMCGPKQFDIPRDCDDALRNYGEKRNGPMLIDVDGADGDEAGNLKPFVADCDMKSYPSTGVTIIPNKLPKENKPEKPGEIPVEYTSDPETIKKLTEVSKFCSQEMSYTCTNSGLMGEGAGVWSGQDKTPRKYWAGGLGRENMCGCGVTKSCAKPKVNCNCDIKDGKERKDFGLIINKADLPVGSVNLKELGGEKKGTLSVGALMCGQNQFGIEPTCQQYREKGYLDDYTYLIDPDGPPRRAEDPVPTETDTEESGINVDPFPVICEMLEDKPVGITTVGHDTEKPTKVDDAEEPGSYKKPVTYTEASPEQLIALADHSSYCTQEMAYKCKKAVIHKVGDLKNPVAFWTGRNGRNNQYFAGGEGSMCQCGIEGNCEGKDFVCNCDANLDKEVTDKGFLSNKDDLPVFQLNFGDTGDADDFGEHTLGKFRCFEVFETCYHMQEFYKKRPHDDIPPNGRYMIDPDGPLGQDPFEVYCHFPKTIVDIEAGNYFAVPDIPEHRGPGAQCYKPHYANANKEQLDALTEKSGFCRQYARYTCKHASFTKNALWKGSNGEKQKGWSGNAGGDKCACGEVGKCEGNGACNCDVSDGQQREDHGLFIDKKLLPVSEICLGLDKGEIKADEKRFAEYFLGSLECSNVQFGIPEDCQRLRNSKTPGEPIVSEPWLIDPDQLGALPPFPVYCEMMKQPPIGITVVEPVPDAEEEIPKDGKDVPIPYKSSTPEQLKALTGVSQYCTQEMSIACKEAALKLGDGFGAYSSGGKLLPYWAGNSGGTDGCKGGTCQCGNADGKEYTDGGSLLDKKVLPVSRVNLAAAEKGTRKLLIEDLRCFALYKTCHEIKMAGQDVNPNWDGRYGIDPDSAGGVEPFAVDCDFVTNPDIGITQIPTESDEEIPVTKDPLKQPVTYLETTPKQANELAKVSEFCLQGMKYTCKLAPLMANGAGFLTFDGTKSKQFAGADNSESEGCACVVLGTCPANQKCRCDAAGPMEAEEGDFVTNRDILPVTGVESKGLTGEGAEASFSVGNLRCGPIPFDLPEDCQQALDWGYKTGEALIWPAPTVAPFLVYCDMDTYPGKGVTIVPTAVVEVPVIGVTEIPVKYDGASPEQIKALVDESEKCLLPMKYECTATKFSKAFSIATPGDKGENNNGVNFFGAGRRSEMCNCGEQKRCGGDDGRQKMEMRHCNCDVGDTKDRVDAGIFGNQGEMPVTSINFKSQGVVTAKGKLTLGSLYCVDKPIDLDECELGFNDCHKKAYCINRNGYYQCVCEEGYRGKGNPKVWANGRECYDDDECALGLCPDNSNCENTPGSFKCKCVKGYMESQDGKCIDVDECTTGDNDCDKKAICTNTEGSFECTCQIGDIGDGKKCEEWGSCSFSGPFVRTFDGKSIQFASGCMYTLARDACGDVTKLGKPAFEVKAKYYFKTPDMEERGTAWVKEVIVTIGDKTVVLQQERTVTLNGIRVKLPVRPAEGLVIYRTGKYVRLVNKQLGVKVIFDGKSWARVKVMDTYKEKMCGICGNYNGKLDDDLTTGPLCNNPGTSTQNVNTLTSSWLIEEKGNDQCSLLCDIAPPEPCLSDEDAQEAAGNCEDLINVQLLGTYEKFTECIELMTATGFDLVANYQDSCRFASCASSPDTSAAICELAEHMATDCLEDVGVKVDIGVWRVEHGCVGNCGNNQLYKSCGAACPETCAEPIGAEICTKQCVEGCFCAEGFVMDDDQCVKKPDCGCVMDDLYYSTGDKILKPGCTEQCECKSSGKMDCNPVKCDESATCAVEDFVNGCFCNEGFSGDGLHCEDINECEEDPVPCDENAKCENTQGSFTCTCKEGFTGDGKSCDNTNECLDGEDNCDVNAECKDTVGSFKCVCKLGFTMNEKTSVCEDVDECDKGRNDCDRSSTICENNPGAFVCTCLTGYSRIDRKECEDIDECIDNLHTCDPNASCGNKIGGYSCTCNIGYEGEGHSCEDFDECEGYSNPCSENQVCKNTVGSFTCPCDKGFEMSPSQKECIDIDECATDKHDCKVENSLCKNIIGLWECECEAGYQGDGKTKCEDINECTQAGPPVCGTNSKCSNTQGYSDSYSCECKEGFASPATNNKNCVDKDECTDGTHDCHKNAVCENTEATFTCKCQKGYEGDGKTCKDIDECTVTKDICGRKSKCTNIPASHTCECVKGYEMAEGMCQNINECDFPELNDCDDLAHCTDLEATFQCQCFTGYSGTGKEGDCAPINECEKKVLNNCKEKSQNCVDEDPGFRCVCKEGFEPFGSDCKDIDECAIEEDDCSPDADCDNTEPAFKCTCKTGYNGDGKKCVDIDECKTTCNTEGQVCKNSPGSYSCTCEEGYINMPDATCKDVDECAMDPVPCSANMDCKNTPGAYECTCSEGYTMADGNKQTCTDEDECANPEGSPCAADEICENSVGGYTCKCYKGYEMAQGSCKDLDECSSPLVCHADALCENTDGSFECTCKSGFNGDGQKCDDVNECKQGSAECSPNGICKNSPGTYECNSCKIGFTGDGKTCEDVNECDENNGGCDQNAECINEEGGFKCKCFKEFSGDGKTCNDIDECTTNTYACPPKSQCKNTEGGYDCNCDTGYVKKFDECANIDECQFPDTCGKDALCTDTTGSFECNCPDYYEMHTDGRTCLAPNDCTYDKLKCAPNEVCTPEIEGAFCYCDQGFQDTRFGCEDIDECVETARLCVAGKICWNTEGSFECLCDDGYQMNDKEECIDINECETGQHMCEETAKCVNTKGGHDCTCEKGFERFEEFGGSISCFNVDECTEELDSCDRNADCFDTIGSYNCGCKQGFTGDGRSCKDIDECASANGCSDRATCIDDVGTYNCECVEGYMGNGFICEDVDECVNGDDDCSKNSECVNTDGGFMCQCKTGYSGHCDACEDVDECATGLAECDENAECYNLDGTYSCDCPKGFQLAFKFCIDVDECALGISDCGRNGDCVNTEGSHECNCHLGYDKNENGLCSDVNECGSNGQLCDDNAECYNTEGSYICICNIGFDGDGDTCKETHPSNCGGQVCHTTAECKNNVCRCPPGARGDPIFGTDGCTDINECDEGTHDCDSNALCKNIGGSFTCACNPGFVGDGFTCDDDSPSGCDSPTACGPLAVCVDEGDGKFHCECGEGLESNGPFECLDINECDDWMICNPDTLCYNTPGSFKCLCEAGLKYDAESDYCADINECEIGTHDCDEKSDGSGFGICSNYDGGYDCACKPGYEGDGRMCTEPNDPGCSKKCDAGQYCQKGTDEDKCVCKSGFQPAGDGKCVATDLCPDLCDKNADCVYDPTTGSSCTCREGYGGNGRFCYNVNECADGTAECDDVADCLDTEGSYKCSCPTGYSLEGFRCTFSPPSEDNCGCGEKGLCTDKIRRICDCDGGYEFLSSKTEDRCADKDECSRSGACHSLAQCTNTVGSYTCACNPGTEGDGRNFCNVEECRSNPCSPDATCADIPGSHTCNCNEGFVGDGYSCRSESSPCNNDNGGCGDNAACTTDAKLATVCVCKVGFEGDGVGCSDVNECETGKHDCSKDATCTNFDGGFTCACNKGFYGDGKVCKNIDECSNGIDDCSENAVCQDLEGGFMCSCNEGYKGDGKTCGMDSGCLTEDICDINAKCLLLDGTYQCACNYGYRGDGTRCTNVNAGECKTVNGDLICECSPGYTPVDGHCTDINECSDPVLNNCESDSVCRNYDGLYECICEDGKPGKNGACGAAHKPDVDECADFTSNNCDRYATCHNTPQAYYCECNIGYQGDGILCTDINECEMGTAECGLNSQCFNFDGSYTCGCLGGFDWDGKACVDIDECGEEYDNDCSDYADCENNEGSYACTCSSGYKGNGQMCLETNPCDEQGVCDDQAVCTNEDKKAICTCRPGFEGNGQTCKRVDACKTGTHNCHPNAKCENKPDGFTCTCKTGFYGDGITNCDDINECDPSTRNGGGHQCDTSNSDCLNQDGGYECVCKFGFERDQQYTCKGYDVCQREEDDCSDNADCKSSTGGFVCKCKEGFQGSGQICNDVDECKDETFNCPSLTVCVNTDGKYKCECKEGYKKEGDKCADIDECSTGGDNCGRNSKCVNTKGAYVCVCDDGYTATSHGCVDSDECGTGTDNCHEFADCANTVGSFTCTCKDGYKKEGNLCKEIDHCAENAVKCGENAMCVPNGDKPHCQCRAGFEGNPDTGCTDIDECKGPNDCSSKANCKNGLAIYTCECKKGYRGNGKVCDDIDDCFEGKDDCNDNADCENTPGLFRCACKVGYDGDGKTCTQINECEKNPTICGDHEKCQDTEGSYLCLCVEGFRRNSAKRCQDIDECAEGSATCHKYAGECIDKDGSYDCKCRTGFEGDGRECKDINECELKTSGCDEHATCTNIDGGAACNCKAGFKGNGYSCIDVDECTAGEPCGDSATCGNTIGSYICSCLPGYREQDDGSCEDINECTDTLDVCPPKAICSNSRGGHQCVCPKGTESVNGGKECKKINPCLSSNCSPYADCIDEGLTFSCKCRDGYTGDGVHCSDSDECAAAKKAGTDICNKDKCVNNQGGYECVCWEGYELIGGLCNNIDECILPPNFANAARCEDSEVCVDTSGSYNCECKRGYQRDGKVCVNINECQEGNRCHPNANCLDNVGSYSCECDVGFAGDGRSCVDVDECSVSPLICGDPKYSKCRNIGGSYTCICADGYTEKGGKCEDIDECALNIANCGSLGHCLNIDGGHLCECQAGYEFNRGQCKNVDECAFGIDNCDVNAYCTDLDGTFKCECRPGFHGDGLTCSKTCGDSTCPGDKSCTVDNGKPTCECKCIGDRCRRHGSVCGSNGVQYSSEKDLIIAACDMGLDIQVDYRGNCKRACEDFRCPRHKVCTLNNAAKPNCRCKACTKEEEESGEVCTDKYRQFYSICHFRQYQCNENPDDDQVITTQGKCPAKVDCVVSDWGAWQPCSVTCGNGVVKKTREIEQDRIGEGEACPALEHTGNCYEAPCPASPCATKVCKGAGEVCVMRKTEAVCECPDCKGLGEEPVCGMYSNGTRTVRNKCTLQKESCVMNEMVYLLYPSTCGENTPNQPLNCGVVPHFDIIETKEGCKTTTRQPVNKCTGGCGSVTGFCCYPSQYRPVFAEVKCSSGPVKREQVNTIKECKCVPKEEAEGNSEPKPAPVKPAPAKPAPAKPVTA